MLDLTSESYARERLAESPLRILREAGKVATEPANQMEKEEFFKALSEEI